MVTNEHNGQTPWSNSARWLQDPQARTLVLAALWVAALLAVPLAGRSTSTEAAAEGRQTETTTSVVPSRPTVPPTVSSTAPIEQQTSPAETPAIGVDDQPEADAPSRPGDSPAFVVAAIADCQDPVLVSGSLAIVTTACVGGSQALATAPSFSITEAVRLVVLPPTVTLLPAAPAEPSAPSVFWNGELATIAGSGENPLVSIGDGWVTVGRLPCRTGNCAVTTDPMLAVRLALAGTSAPDGLDPDPLADCAEQVHRLVTLVQPPASGTDVDPGIACTDTATEVQFADDQGCFEDPGGGRPPETPGGLYELRLVEIGFGVEDSFTPTVTLPAASRLCLDETFGSGELRVRFKTVVTAGTPLPGLLTQRPVDPSLPLPGPDSTQPAGNTPVPTAPQTTEESLS